MILLQITDSLNAIDSLSNNNLSSHKFAFTIEIVILVLVVLYQLKISIELVNKINKLKSVFDNDLTVIYGFIEKNKIGNVPDILTSD